MLRSGSGIIIPHWYTAEHAGIVMKLPDLLSGDVRFLKRSLRLQGTLPLIEMTSKNRDS